MHCSMLANVALHSCYSARAGSHCKAVKPRVTPLPIIEMAGVTRRVAWCGSAWCSRAGRDSHTRQDRTQRDIATSDATRTEDELTVWQDAQARLARMEEQEAAHE